MPVWRAVASCCGVASVRVAERAPCPPLELWEDIGGIAVHIAARVGGLAGADEVLVSRTVKDLVAGSGIQFGDRGSHTLKGVPDDWHLLAVLDG